MSREHTIIRQIQYKFKSIANIIEYKLNSFVSQTIHAICSAIVYRISCQSDSTLGLSIDLLYVIQILLSIILFFPNQTIFKYEMN